MDDLIKTNCKGRIKYKEFYNWTVSIGSPYTISTITEEQHGYYMLNSAAMIYVFLNEEDTIAFKLRFGI